MRSVLLKIHLLACLLVLAPGQASAADWSVTKVSLLHGDKFKIDDQSQYTITVEHARSWAYGDFYAFIDMFNPGKGDSTEYGEIHPRFSLSRITGNDFSNSLISDLYIATEVELGENHRTWLYGLGFDFKAPGFDYFSMNVYVRDNVRLSGKTWQITPYWQMPFKIGNTHWSFEGFADIAGSEDSAEDNILFHPQILWDAGAELGKPGQLKIGLELGYWGNKYGVKDEDEFNPQMLVKFIF